MYTYMRVYASTHRRSHHAASCKAPHDAV
jgi:hypothetical protein